MPYNNASTVTQLDDRATPPATVGTNSVNRRTVYTPPCSKGPGAKEYILTVYALSKAPALSDPTAVTRQVLLDAMEGSVLASSTLSVGTPAREERGQPTGPFSFWGWQ